MAVKYLSEEEVLTIHRLVVDPTKFGKRRLTEDQSDVINPSGLNSARLAAAQTWGGEELYPDILLKAAVLMRSLVKNHPFLDGNKRTAAICTIRFLEYNGYRMRQNIEARLIALATQVARDNEPGAKGRPKRRKISLQRVRSRLAQMAEPVIQRPVKSSAMVVVAAEPPTGIESEGLMKKVWRFLRLDKRDT